MEEEVQVVDFNMLGAEEEPAAPVRQSPYDFDFFVIGGGSGGLSAAKAAAELGAKVAIADFVTPSPQGTKWGLGGTCVNVGCIPKKLMHYAGFYGEHMRDQIECGWQLPPDVSHNWEHMVNNVQKHIQTLNWGYRMQLMDKSVTYYNFYAVFVDQNTVSLQDINGVEKKRVTSEKFLIAVGGRPSFGDFPGAQEHCLTSDDLFSIKAIGGRVLVVGASYIALECAGFLHAFGRDVTVMVRSIFLRGFDQEMAEKVGTFMEEGGVKFLRNTVPLIFAKNAEGKVIVTYSENGEGKTDVFDAVLLAIGRTALTSRLNLEAVGVETNPRNGKIMCDESDKSTATNIWAIGDVANGRPELTPSAIHAGNLLAKRLFGGSPLKMDYVNIATTVFTPVEYACCGYSEEEAIQLYGDERVDVFHTSFKPLEWNFLEKRKNQNCFAKVIVDLEDKSRVIGIHFLGPHAGEVMQGFAVAMKAGITKEMLEMTVGIHPTCAEEFTKDIVTKRSGENAEKTGC